MKLKKLSLVGSEIFEVKTKRGYDAPFNLEFDIKESGNNKANFNGSGIYIITYDKNPIYIGLFRPFGRNDVRKVRWKKHIKTFTNRGYNLGIGKKILDSIKDKKYPEDLISNYRVQSTGCQTSKNRLKFAHKNWGKFNGDKDNLQVELKNFSFNYYQLSWKSDDGLENKSLFPNIAASLESYLIAKFKPECNKEGVDGRNKVTVENIESKMKSFIESINNFKLNPDF